MNRTVTSFILLVIATIILAVANIMCGAVSIPVNAVFDILFGDGCDNRAWEYIIIESRLPQMITAFISGAALSVSGLLLQTAFANPLAGPSILGINSGAGLGVAIVMMLTGGVLSFAGTQMAGIAATTLSAMIGAFAVMFVILAIAVKVRNKITLLIAGLMVGYLVSSVVSILSSISNSEGIQNFVMWGFGSFGGVTLKLLPLYASLLTIGLLCAILLIKPLNALLLGNNYAENLGVNIRRIRMYLLANTGLLAAVITSFCGPISFIDVVVPHIARMIIRTDNHIKLVPCTMLTGGVIALFCNLMTIIPTNGVTIPLNAITPIIGAPVIIYLLIRK